MQCGHLFLCVWLLEITVLVDFVVSISQVQQRIILQHISAAHSWKAGVHESKTLTKSRQSLRDKVDLGIIWKDMLTVFCICCSSWIAQREEATDWEKQKKVCTKNSTIANKPSSGDTLMTDKKIGFMHWGGTNISLSLLLFKPPSHH